MLNAATVISLAAALTGINTEAPKPNPAPLPNGTVIVKILPNAKTYDADYAIEGEEESNSPSPDKRYEEMKAKLDERFAYMFQLKKEIDEQNMQANAKWEEYHVLREAYERQLKKIVADWVTDQHYSDYGDNYRNMK